MLEEAKEPEGDEDREADAERHREVPRQVHAELGLDEDGEEADQQRAEDEEDNAESHRPRRESLAAGHGAPRRRGSAAPDPRALPSSRRATAPPRVRR